jgi:hypothetical protein
MPCVGVRLGPAIARTRRGKMKTPLNITAAIACGRLVSGGAVQLMHRHSLPEPTLACGSFEMAESLHAFSKAHVMPSAFIAAVIGSEKKIGSTRSTISPDTSRKFRLFSNGTSARRAPLSIATCKGSASERTDLMFP